MYLFQQTHCLPWSSSDHLIKTAAYTATNLFAYHEALWWKEMIAAQHFPRQWRVLRLQVSLYQPVE